MEPLKAGKILVISLLIFCFLFWILAIDKSSNLLQLGKALIYFIVGSMFGIVSILIGIFTPKDDEN